MIIQQYALDVKLLIKAVSKLKIPKLPNLLPEFRQKKKTIKAH